MSKGSPSMIALLGLLAVAGYQNRDRLADLLNGGGGPDGDPGTRRDRGIVDGLRDMVGSGGNASHGGGLMGGLSDILDRFTGSAQASKAQSWIGKGANDNLAPAELESVLDDETLADLSVKTGLSRSELLHRLSVTLPEAVDRATPEGRFRTVAG